MSLVTETKHLWIGGLALLTLAASVEIRSALWLNLGSVQYHRTVLGDDPPAGEQARRALDLANRASALNPTSSRAHVLAATIQSAEGDAPAAIRRLERAVVLEPANAGVRFQLAEAYHSVGDEASALQHWRAAGAAPMLQQLGGIARRAGDLAEAVEYFERAIRVDPTAYEPRIALGNTFVGLGRLEEARLAYVQAVERQPGWTTAYERLATLLNGPLGRPDQAEAVIADAMTRVHSPGPELYLLRSQVAFGRGDHAAAERDARRAIDLSPRRGTYLAWLGELYYHQKRYPEALAQYSRTGSDASDPTWRWRSFRRIGQTYAAQQNWDAAVEAYRTAVAISRAQGAPAQVLSENHLALGEALQQNGEIELARAEFNRALAQDPTNRRAAQWLAALRKS